MKRGRCDPPRAWSQRRHGGGRDSAQEETTSQRAGVSEDMGEGLRSTGWSWQRMLSMREEKALRRWLLQRLGGSDDVVLVVPKDHQPEEGL